MSNHDRILAMRQLADKINDDPLQTADWLDRGIDHVASRYFRWGLAIGFVAAYVIALLFPIR